MHNTCGAQRQSTMDRKLSWRYNLIFTN